MCGKLSVGTMTPDGQSKEVLVIRSVRAFRCIGVCCLVIALAAMGLTACRSGTAQPTKGLAEEDSNTSVDSIAGEWRMLHRGTELLSKVGLSLSDDGTFVSLGQQGEEIDTGVYTYEDEILKLMGDPCTGASGLKIDPCIGTYKVVTRLERNKIVAITLQLIEDPSLSRSLDFGGQEFARPK